MAQISSKKVSCGGICFWVCWSVTEFWKRYSVLLFGMEMCLIMGKTFENGTYIRKNPVWIVGKIGFKIGLGTRKILFENWEFLIRGFLKVLKALDSLKYIFSLFQRLLYCIRQKIPWPLCPILQMTSNPWRFLPFHPTTSVNVKIYKTEIYKFTNFR